jgi:hypothetical protein
VNTDPRAQLAELRHLSMADLKERWRDLVGTDPPQYSRSFLVSRLAYRLQELAYGGLSPSAIADMDAILDDAGCDKLGRIRRRRNGGPGHRKLLIGTRLARESDGDRHEVTVVKGGFEYRRERFSSLSAITMRILSSALTRRRVTFFALRIRWRGRSPRFCLGASGVLASPDPRCSPSPAISNPASISLLLSGLPGLPSQEQKHPLNSAQTVASPLSHNR